MGSGWSLSVRRGAALRLAVVLAVGVTAGLAIGLTLHTGTRTITLRATTVEVVNGLRSAAARPAPIPTLLEGANNPHDLTLASAVPSDATLDSADYVTAAPKQLIVTWERAHLTSNGRAAMWQRHGMAIWQRDPGDAATWHRVFTFENPITNTEDTVDNFRVTTGDISGDGRPEVLVFFDTDGSAGSGTYHLFTNTGFQLRQPLVKRLSLDEGTISFEHGALAIHEGLDHYGLGIHCCFRKVKTTLARWNGHRLMTLRWTMGPNQRGWPPG